MAEVKRRNTLWMRYVDFLKLAHLLEIIDDNNGVLKAMQLERLAVEKGLFRKPDGSVFTHTTRYHYRKVLEGLGLAIIKNDKYYINPSSKASEITRLLKKEGKLSESAKELLRQIIVSNRDCQRNFFDVFMDIDSYDLELLRKHGKPAMVGERSSPDLSTQEKKVLKPLSHKGKTITYSSPDRLNAIFWGVRHWALSLDIVDEVMINSFSKRIIYPLATSTEEEVISRIILELGTYFKQSKRDWITINVADFLFNTAAQTRYPLEVLKKALRKYIASNAESVVIVSSSAPIVEFASTNMRQFKLIEKMNLQTTDGLYITHLRLLNKGG